MDKRKIKATLIEKGILQKEIAEKIGVTRSCVSSIINGHRQSRKVKQAVADALNVNVGELWPGE